jgi:hypothetical protein
MGYAANPDMGGLVYFVNDIGSPGTTIVIPLYGANHTYLLMGDWGNGNVTQNGNSTRTTLALRYE